MEDDFTEDDAKVVSENMAKVLRFAEDSAAKTKISQTGFVMMMVKAIIVYNVAYDQFSPAAIVDLVNDAINQGMEQRPEVATRH